MNRYLIPGMILALAVSACAAGTGDTTDSPDTTPSPTLEIEETPEPTEDPENGDAPQLGHIDAGPIPDVILADIVEDALERTGTDVSDIEVVEAHSETWNDGALGCPQPGQMYTQALEPGYQLILQVGDERLDYHISERGTFVLCDDGMSSGAGPTES